MAKGKPSTAKFGDEALIDLGRNGTTILAQEKNSYISFAIPKIKGDGFSQGFIRFKAFISDFSRSAESEYEEASFSVATAPRAIKGPVKNNISLTFEVPSQTLNEARINLTRINALCRFFLTDKQKLKDHLHNPDDYTVYVLFSNFIHNFGTGGSTKFSAETYNEVVEHGQESILIDFSFEIDLEAGMFEGDPKASSRDDGKLFPKNMKISMTLSPVIEDITLENAGVGFIAYGDDGYKPSDIERTPFNYPFGIDYDGS